MTTPIQAKWKEIIETANNQDAHYSFELFEGLIEKAKQEGKKQQIEDEIKFLENLGGLLIIENHPNRFECIDRFEKRLDKLQKEKNEK